MEPIDVLVSEFDPKSVTETGESADGVRVHARSVRKVVDRQAYHTRLAFEWADVESSVCVASGGKAVVLEQLQFG